MKRPDNRDRTLELPISSTDVNRCLTVGEWEIDPAGAEIRKGTTTQHLTPQQFALLIYLIQRSGLLVSKEELFEAIWRDTTVEDVGLPRCIYELRKALGDEARHPRYIETIPRRGYRFIAEVRPVEPRPIRYTTKTDRETPARDEPSSSSLTQLLAVAAALLVIWLSACRRTSARHNLQTSSADSRDDAPANR